MKAVHLTAATVSVGAVANALGVEFSVVAEAIDARTQEVAEADDGKVEIDWWGPDGRLSESSVVWLTRNIPDPADACEP